MSHMWNACCTTIGFLHKKVKPSSDTYRKPAGAFAVSIYVWSPSSEGHELVPPHLMVSSNPGKFRFNAGST